MTCCSLAFRALAVACWAGLLWNDQAHGPLRWAALAVSLLCLSSALLLGGREGWLPAMAVMGGALARVSAEPWVGDLVLAALPYALVVRFAGWPSCRPRPMSTGRLLVPLAAWPTVAAGLLLVAPDVVDGATLCLGAGCVLWLMWRARALRRRPRPNLAIQALLVASFVTALVVRPTVASTGLVVAGVLRCAVASTADWCESRWKWAAVLAAAAITLGLKWP